MKAAGCSCCGCDELKWGVDLLGSRPSKASWTCAAWWLIGPWNLANVWSVNTKTRRPLKKPREHRGRASLRISGVRSRLWTRVGRNCATAPKNGRRASTTFYGWVPAVRTEQRTVRSQPTILAKIMWDTLVECAASTSERFRSHEDKRSLGQILLPSSPHAMLFVRKGKACWRVVQHCIGGRGGGGGGGGGWERIMQEFGIKGKVPHTCWPGL